MESTKSIRKRLDASIDAMDLDAIEQELSKLDAISPSPRCCEDPLVFSARIQKLHKEKNAMKHSHKLLRTAVIAAVIAAMGLTVYASAHNWFSFTVPEDGRYITGRSSDAITEREIQDLIVQPEETDSSAPEANVAPTIEPQEFTSVEEAVAAMDMEVILPAKMPDMTLDSADGSTMYFDSSETRTLWLNYSDDSDRRFGVTIVRKIIESGSQVTSYTEHYVDPGSFGTYKSKSGIEYATMTESNEDGSMVANIATTTIGEYEYALVFVGFDDLEYKAIIDSVDLSPLK